MSRVYEPFNDPTIADFEYRSSFSERMKKKEAHYAEVRAWVFRRTLVGKGLTLLENVGEFLMFWRKREHD